MALIAPSILSANFAHMGEEIRKVAAAGADWIHIDVMDGHFVPNITLGPPVIASLRTYTPLPFDVHLMISQPERYIEAFAAAGAQIICVQVEACTHLHRTLQQIRQAGCQAAAALNPATPPEEIAYVLENLDMILIMTVNPGFGGQEFISAMLPKIRRVREMIHAAGLTVKIEVDGGVNERTVGAVAQAGCDVFVAGTAIFGKPDYAQTIARLRQLIARAREGKEKP